MMKRASSTGKACSLDDISEDTTQLFTLSSPRSAEALACHGMLLEDLQYRPLEEYKERGVPHEVASLRYEHNEAGRRERIKQVKHEYRVICGTPAHSRRSSAEFVGPAGSTVDASSMDSGAKEILAMKKQLEIMKNKQREDLIDSLMTDFRKQKLMEMAEEKEQEARARDEAVARARLLKAKEWEAVKAEREARKKEQERLEELERKKLAEEVFQQGQQAVIRAQHEEKMRKIESQNREAERTKKAIELQKQTAALFAERQRQADERKRMMDEKDAVLKAAMEKQRHELQMENQRKREETEARMAAVADVQMRAKQEQERAIKEKNRLAEEKRRAFEAQRAEDFLEAKHAAEAKAEHIRSIIEQNQRMEEGKKDKFKEKEAEALERLRLLAIEKEREDARKQQERDEKERARLEKIEKAFANEEARKMQLLEKFEADGHKLEKVMEQRNQDIMMKNERDRLNKQDKMEAVQRLQRVEAYNREKSLQQMMADNERLAELNQRKYLLQKEKIAFRKEQEIMKTKIRAAVEKFAKTKVWQPPPGIDMELDIHAIKAKAEAQLVRSSREPSQSSVSRVSVSGSVGHGGFKHESSRSTAEIRPLTTPIKKKKAPLSARGRMQDSGSNDAVVLLPTRKTRPSSAYQSSQAYAPDFENESPAYTDPNNVGGETAGLEIDVGQQYALDERREKIRDERAPQLWNERNTDYYSNSISKDALRHDSSGQALKVKKSRKDSSKNAYRPDWPPSHGIDMLMGERSSKAEVAYASRPAKKVKKKAITQAPILPSRLAAMQVLDGLRRQQNEQLLAVLEEEQAKEAEREVRMSSVFQHKEKANLERVFAHERAEASQRIIDITSLHEKVLAQSMIKLGLT